MKRLLILGLPCALALFGAVGCQTPGLGEPHTRAGYWAGAGYYKPPAAVGPQSISVVSMDHSSQIGPPADPVPVPASEPTVLLNQRFRSRSRNVAAAVAVPDCPPDDLGARMARIEAREARIEVMLKACLPQTPPVAQKMPPGQPE